jgi:N-methylhydantoinase A/oxoprolinase/acetone carboxylase beta subunit
VGVQSAGEVPGPLIIEELDTTVVVPPGWMTRIDEHGFITLTKEASA